jgi:gamma-glutamylcyclotransferase (GGCT)/AIG2-like uncharacterized protein YtfP
MKTAVFAYGTLQLPEIMEAVTGRRFPSCTAYLRDYARYSLKGRSYPGIRWQPGALTRGILYTGVDAEPLRQLDEFEDHFYRRATVKVTTENGEMVPAQIYLVPPQHYELLASRPWNLDDFKETSLTGFLTRCRGT